jgi:hypothetical protein
MALIADKSVKVFDLTAIHRSDCVSIRRTGDTAFKNGFVTKTSESEIEILYSNTQNNATSYLKVSAADVAIGVWELYWTTDFQTIYHENNAPSTGGGT